MPQQQACLEAAIAALRSDAEQALAQARGAVKVAEAAIERQLSFLAPEITKTIFPPELTANKLILAGKLPSVWSDQRRYLGLD